MPGGWFAPWGTYEKRILPRAWGRMLMQAKTLRRLGRRNHRKRRERHDMVTRDGLPTEMSGAVDQPRPIRCSLVVEQPIRAPIAGINRAIEIIVPDLSTGRSPEGDGGSKGCRIGRAACTSH